ncbi:hypothetical protein [Lentibacillus amyloliquefaciens]|uniref:Uncharacterized protein n=1 Tax=Lentibacillus amyloliquefaciens TaxID=1472767 RepID=A0A0U4GAC4_9BACI|nr:hypothetical protein [Lentibacillus amyloliquefaciens]ALX49690.1 hypothetical protein AOX59_14595 [Lentibacillus amyloliquefaciens]
MHQFMIGLFQKWEIVYATQNIDDYYKAKNRLNKKGISYKVSTLTTNNGKNRRKGTVTTYHLKVKEEDVQRSYDIIHQRLA